MAMPRFRTFCVGGGGYLVFLLTGPIALSHPQVCSQLTAGIVSSRIAYTPETKTDVKIHEV